LKPAGTEGKMIDCKIDFGGMAWVEGAPGARFKVFKHEGKQIRLLEFRREFVEPDWCRKGHIGYILEGELEVEFSDLCCQVSSPDSNGGGPVFGQVGTPDRTPNTESCCHVPSHDSRGNGQVGSPDRTSLVVTFKAGDGVFIPAGETHKHKARAVSEVARLVLVEEV
jgi:hypothetical protein